MNAFSSRRYDVFLCHATEDKEKVVRPLKVELARKGISYWVDEESVVWGADLVGGIGQGLAESSFVVVVLSKAFATKAWAVRELNSMLARDMRRGENRILPLLVPGPDGVRDILDRFPLLEGLSYRMWWGDASGVASQVDSRLKAAPRAVQAPIVGSTLYGQEMRITTDFWAGRFQESATASTTMLEVALKRKNDAEALLSLSNLILIARGRGDFRSVDRLIRNYAPRIDFARVSGEFRYRLLKELFVASYESDNWRRAQHYLTRMRRIDPSLTLFSPGDDWIPGTVRWRAAHLGWLLNGTTKSLAEGVSFAQEGVEYLNDRRRENPNLAGLASAHLNVGWLYYLRDDPVCLDYFAIAAEEASAYSPRTEVESRIGGELANAKFGAGLRQGVAHRLAGHIEDLFAGGYSMRSYAFLQRDSQWGEFGHLLMPVRQS